MTSVDCRKTKLIPKMNSATTDTTGLRRGQTAGVRRFLRQRQPEKYRSEFRTNHRRDPSADDGPKTKGCEHEPDEPYVEVEQLLEVRVGIGEGAERRVPDKKNRKRGGDERTDPQRRCIEAA